MLFLLLFAAVALGTVAFVCLPLLRGVPTVADRGYFDRVVYRDQLTEVERDLARGVLRPAEADSARLEIQRRLLSVQVGAPGRATWSAPSPRLAAIVALLLLGGAVGLYAWLGAPSLPDAPYAARRAQHGEQPPAADAAPGLDMRQAAEQFARKLKADPANADVWVLYARAESILGDYKTAGAAYRHAIDLGQKAPGVFAGYGEMQVLAADGIVSPGAHDAFIQALAADPKNAVARYYLALADGQAGEEKRAIARWLALAADIPDDSPMRESIAQGVAEAARAGGIAAPALPKGTAPPPDPDATDAHSGPNRSQAAAAAQMPKAERRQMIETMATQLAARLQREPNDLANWLRLGRAYALLGETGRSADAFARAAALKPDDVSIKLQEFQALIANVPPNEPLPPRAAALLRQVAAIAPDQPEALWYLGVEAARAGDAGAARRDWTKLLASLPAGGADAKLVKRALDTLPK
ncbi:MAG TPA: c-type cytochrome biogenesis protein CcmI [Acetobacteraceae bacterium]|nr:c-type cytochrome biogenesis protein CcmI [Acetobacteraceae bacterium]